MNVANFTNVSSRHVRRQADDVERIDTRFLHRNTPILAGTMLSETYDALKRYWMDQQPLRVEQVTQWVRGRKGADDVALGKDEFATLEAISALRVEARSDAHASPLFRKTLDEACARVVAVNGIMAMFRTRMLLPPDPPEPW